MLPANLQTSVVHRYMASWRIVLPSMKKFKMENIALQSHWVHHLHHLVLIPLRRKISWLQQLSPLPYHRDNCHLLRYQIVLQVLPRFLLELVCPHLFQLGPRTQLLPLLQLSLVGMQVEPTWVSGLDLANIVQ
jgi:hypothetical protein